MKDRLRKMAKEHSQHGINAPEAVEEPNLKLGGQEISALEYGALKEITSLYNSTPEKEYDGGSIRIKDESVTYYDIHRKGLGRLPDSIGSLTSLKFLYASDNDLQSLPESIGNLASLYLLSVSRNQLQSLPESIGSLASITVLDVCDNQLGRSEKEKLKKLFGDKVCL